MSEGGGQPLRTGDADRERTLQALRDAASDGRLTFEELAERTELVHSARTHEELAAATADLGGPPSEHAAAEPSRQLAVLSSVERGGRWRLEPRSRFTAVLGSIRLDLSEAILPGPEVEIEGVSVLGSAELVVPEGVHVDVTGNAFFSGRTLAMVGTSSPGAPTLQVRASGVLGSLTIRTRPRMLDLLKDSARDLAGGLLRPPGPPPPPPPGLP